MDAADGSAQKPTPTRPQVKSDANAGSGCPEVRQRENATANTAADLNDGVCRKRTRQSSTTGTRAYAAGSARLTKMVKLLFRAPKGAPRRASSFDVPSANSK